VGCATQLQGALRSPVGKLMALTALQERSVHDVHDVRKQFASAVEKMAETKPLDPNGHNSRNRSGSLHFAAQFQSDQPQYC
jgi:hypothetical protein